MHQRHNETKNDQSLGQTWRSKDKDEDQEDADMPDPSGLTDDELKAALLTHGVKAGPIVASTRALYEKKLRKLLQADGHSCLNGAEKSVLYSDSEEEEENGEGHEESGSEETKEERVEQSDQAQQESSQVASGSQSVMPNGCSQAFSITQMVEQMESRGSLSTSTHTESELNGSNVQQNWSRSNTMDVPIMDKYTMNNKTLYYTPKAYPSKCGMKRSPEPDIFKDMFPDTEATPTGISVTRRRPIKGAAGRPIQYAYPDTPVSPMTLERRAVERRLVPIQIQILVFLIGACLLYIIYACVEDNSFSPFLALLDGLNQELDSEERLLLQAETYDTPVLSGQE